MYKCPKEMHACNDVSARQNERLKVFKHKPKEEVKLSFKKMAKRRRKTVLPFGNRVNTCVILTSFQLVAFKKQCSSCNFSDVIGNAIFMLNGLPYS